MEKKISKNLDIPREVCPLFRKKKFPVRCRINQILLSHSHWKFSEIQTGIFDRMKSDLDLCDRASGIIKSELFPKVPLFNLQ